MIVNTAPDYVFGKNWCWCEKKLFLFIRTQTLYWALLFTILSNNKFNTIIIIVPFLIIIIIPIMQVDQVGDDNNDDDDEDALID